MFFLLVLLFDLLFFFFFSSRRRHTRYIGDWSSDVCSSDLPISASRSRQRDCENSSDLKSLRACLVLARADGFCLRLVSRISRMHDCMMAFKIGRASCRERV